LASVKTDDHVSCHFFGSGFERSLTSHCVCDAYFRLTNVTATKVASFL